MTHECMRNYNEFICYHLESSDPVTRVWALKAAIAYSMLYESLAKDVYIILKSQMFKSNNVTVWETAISGIVDLVLRYSLNKMEQRDEGSNTQDINGTGKSKRGGRMLYTEDGEEAEEIDMAESIDTIQVRRKFTFIGISLTFSLPLDVDAHSRPKSRPKSLPRNDNRLVQAHPSWAALHA